MVKLPGTIITGILKFENSLFTKEVIIGPGLLSCSSTFAAKTYGTKVNAITLSKEQYDFASKQIFFIKI